MFGSPATHRKALLLAAVAFAIGGCGADGNTDNTPAGVPATPATTTGGSETAAPPEAITADAEVVGQFIEVAFDDSGCFVTGPAEVTAGDHSFVVTNMSEEHLDLYVSLLEDDHAYQELIDLQIAPGRYYLKPQWVTYSRRSTPDVQIELGPNQHLDGYELEPGPHAIYIGTSNNGLWFCAPLLVTEASSTPAEIIEVSFDGSTCTADVPVVLPSGVRSFVLTDLTGEGLADVRTMAIADDHTYQDLLDLQGEEGEYVTLPAWADWPLTTFEPVERELAENEIGKKLILEPGEHAIAVGTGKGTWFCGTLQVTEP